MFGVLCGHLLRSSRSDRIKLQLLVGGGVLSLGLGLLWGMAFPIITRLWTSSYTLYANGWCMLLFGLFYWVIDVLRFRAWTFFFVVIGVNAITVYLLPHVVDFRKLVHFFFGALLDRAGSFQAVLDPIVVFAVEWLLLLYLYRKRLFIRV